MANTPQEIVGNSAKNVGLFVEIFLRETLVASVVYESHCSIAARSNILIKS
jgi:hypothetical protein